MSHQDIVAKIPSGFKKIASTQNSKFAIISNEKKKLYGVQFHPEVTHTENGKIILEKVLELLLFPTRQDMRESGKTM